MAKVIFSDGSKDMAHNLDDLRERWELRRQVVIQTNNKHEHRAEAKLFLPTVVNTEELSVEDIEQVRDALRIKEKYLRLRYSEVNSLDPRSLLRSEQIERNRERSALTIALHRVSVQQEEMTQALKRKLTYRKHEDQSGELFIDFHAAKARQRWLTARGEELKAVIGELRQKRTGGENFTQDDRAALSRAENAERLAMMEWQEIEDGISACKPLTESRIIQKKDGYIRTLQDAQLGLQQELILAQRQIIELQTQVIELADKSPINWRKQAIDLIRNGGVGEDSLKEAMGDELASELIAEAAAYDEMASTSAFYLNDMARRSAEAFAAMRKNTTNE